MASSQPVNQDNRTKNIVRGIGSLSLQGILTALLGFVLLGSLLRFLPSSAYGVYSSVQVSVGLASVLSTFGFGYAAVKFLALESAREGSSGWGAAKASLTLTILLTGVTAIVLAVVAPSLAVFFLKDTSLAWVFYLGALWLVTNSLSGLFLAVLQAMRRYNLLAQIVLGSRLIAVAVAIVGLVLYRSLQLAILSWVIYGGIICFGVFILIRKSIMRVDSKPYYRPVIRYATPLGIAGIVTAIAGNADIVVVGGYLDPVSLGVYNATVVISSVIAAFFVGPLTTVLFAETSLSSETHGEVSKGAELALRFSTLTVLPASLFAAATASQLFELFSGGGPFTRGIPYLQLITLFYFFPAIQAIAIYILQAVGKTREVLIVGLITSIGQIGLSVALVPNLGLAGAAVSRVIVISGGCFFSLYLMREYLKGAVNLRFFSLALASAAPPATVVFLLSTFVSNRIITLVPYTLFAAALFLASARVLHLLTPEDKSFLTHILPARLSWISRLL
jgi:O-antigen/teichoic acid export membrane protein